ncbi:hypothetical protein FKM82_023861 [Ascaphus truei]
MKFPPAPESINAAVEVRKVGPERETGIVNLLGSSLLGGGQGDSVPRERPFVLTGLSRFPEMVDGYGYAAQKLRNDGMIPQ